MVAGAFVWQDFAGRPLISAFTANVGQVVNLRRVVNPPSDLWSAADQPIDNRSAGLPACPTVEPAVPVLSPKDIAWADRARANPMALMTEKDLLRGPRLANAIPEGERRQRAAKINRTGLIRAETGDAPPPGAGTATEITFRPSIMPEGRDARESLPRRLAQFSARSDGREPQLARRAS
jgi:hypothetical protein